MKRTRPQQDHIVEQSSRKKQRLNNDHQNNDNIEKLEQKQQNHEQAQIGLSIADLPIDTYGHVFSFLDIAELFRSRRICYEVNQHFNELLKQMKHINFADRSVSSSVLKQISNCINLHTLNLNKTKNVSRSALTTIVSNCKDLKRLYIEQCPRMNTKAVNIILKCAQTNNNLLTNLSLSKCDRINAQVLMGIKPHGATLTHLNLAFSSFPSQQVRCLDLVCPNLIYLNLSGIPIRQSSPSLNKLNEKFENEVISNIQKENTNIQLNRGFKYMQTLDMSHSSPMVVSKLINEEFWLNSLTTLYLDSICSDFNHTNILDVLPAGSLPNLKHISLIKAIKRTYSLTSLMNACPEGLISVDLSLCHIDSSALIEFIKHYCDTLEHLHLFCVPVTLDVWRTIMHSCKKLRQLTFVHPFPYRTYINMFLLHDPRDRDQGISFSRVWDIYESLPNLKLLRFSSFAPDYTDEIRSLVDSGILRLQSPEQSYPL